jgi:hypothetical protein
MAAIGITPTDFDFSLLTQTGRKAGARAAGADAESFLTSLKVRLAEMQSQTFEMLIGATSGTSEKGAGLDALLGKTGAAAGADPTLPGLEASSRNMTLFDPESAYRMMTSINEKDVTYKAQFSELSEMKSHLAAMREAALSLGDIGPAADASAIKSRLEAFAGKYNDWIARFDGDLRAGGLLAGTQAAQVAQWELEQSVESMFNGAAAGVRGMRDLGFTVDAATNLASLDGTRLEAVIAGNKAGVVDALREFGADLARAAELLNSDNNFMLRLLDNLDRVIDYIGDNKTSLQAEFGLGDPVKPTGQVAKALASYNQIHAMAG